LAPEKQVADFVRLAERFPEHTFVIAGDGPERVALSRLIARLPAQNCHLLGRLEGADLRAFYRSLDLFCLLSKTETFGLAAGEASAQRVPVIAARGSGTGEVIADRVSGLLFDPDQPQGAATKLALLVRSPELRRQMGEAGRKRMRSFGFEPYLERMMGLLHQGKKV
jgi:glycosyltransferase involved in cell wall biosynthesis